MSCLPVRNLAIGLARVGITTPLDWGGCQYQPPLYFNDGLIQTLVVDYWYGTTWRKWGDRAPWLRHLPPVPWQEQIFTGAEEVPLWGIWSSPPDAKGTIIFSTGINGIVNNEWYATLLGRKAYHRNFAILLYDWRGHGKTAELSPIPYSYGWREGQDQLHLAEQLTNLGCPAPVILTGASMGGQLALWGVKAAMESKSSPICGGATLCTNLESSLSLAHLQSTMMGRKIEQSFTRKFRAEAEKRRKLFPQSLKPGALERMISVDNCDREMVIDYYGFNSVEDYYQQTSALYFLDQLTLPYLIIYAEDDPLFDPQIIPHMKQRMAQNPNAHLILTKKGGHIGHINALHRLEDRFWGMNRLLDFCETLIGQTPSPNNPNHT
ncbi:alpha/beta fold hydrolase [Roseofilum sp. BLCC_M91]|uniref:Alpha/beta fold hydrolase n=1 Tax=Roseofilum halophilum BLCC-M91 TaxID=3022259 RepID=A0ABT7BQB7_9CYAN|nr:alpha/beta fold hydrolase [Roseofilum halophilum]MDJ1180488.1 alpha/beta fold hydrolase [Roseofilum halophilum BLCC-M91]